MSGFDTSGEIVLPFPHLHPEPRGYRWSDLNPFTQGYVEALFEDWRCRALRLPEVDRYEWPDFGAGPKPFWQEQERPWPEAAIDADGIHWDIVWHGVGESGAWKRCRAQEVWHTPAFSDLAPETLARIMEDCERREAYVGTSHHIAETRRVFGRQFWQFRNDQQGLTKHDFPPQTPYLGDAGKVYLRDAPSPSSDRGGS